MNYIIDWLKVFFNFDVCDFLQLYRHGLTFYYCDQTLHVNASVYISPADFNFFGEPLSIKNISGDFE